MTRIVSVAIMIRTENIIVSAPPPARHHDIIYPLYHTVPQWIIQPDDQGFLTSEGQFVDRKAAWTIAKKANQIKEIKGVEGTLFSEHLW